MSQIATLQSIKFCHKLFKNRFLVASNLVHLDQLLALKGYLWQRFSTWVYASSFQGVCQTSNQLKTILFQL